MKGLEWSELGVLQTSVVLEESEAGGGVNGVLGEFGANAIYTFCFTFRGSTLTIFPWLLLWRCGVSHST